MKPDTALIHHGYVAPQDFQSPQIAVHKASSVFFPHVKAMRERNWLDKTGYTYGLHGTPTTFTLEERLCQLEGAKHALLLPSGLAALAQVNLGLLKSGDEILIPDNAYAPLKSLAEAELAHWGITHQYYDPMNPQSLAESIGPQTRLVWLEAPGSVTLEFPDLPSLLRICQSHGVWTALDNTWGAGIAFSAFNCLPDAPLGQQGVDISVHALTKYPSGGGDVLMGSITTCRDDLAKRLKLSHMRLGFGVGGNDAELVLRSLPSIGMRYRAQDASCRRVAAWCLQQPAIAQVLHPAVTSSPGHAHWRDLCAQGLAEDAPVHSGGAAASLLGLRFHPRFKPSQVDDFCNRLTCFKLGYSWAGPISLAVPYDLKTMRQMADSSLLEGGYVRLSIGWEAADDLTEDLAQALAAFTQEN